MRKRDPKEIDHYARWSFLTATNENDPAPISELRELIPTFNRWVIRFKNDGNPERSPLADQLMNLATFASCRVSELKGSIEAAALQTALCAWMDRHHFADEWIADAALCTLFQHAGSKVPEQAWYLFASPDQTHPQVTFPQLQFRPESVEHFDRRCKEHEAEFRRRKKEYRLAMQLRLGSRAGQLVPAKLTALRFAGLTWDEIAERERSNSDTVRKNVRNFAKRAGLTLPEWPFTLGETLGTMGKESSKSGH